MQYWRPTGQETGTIPQSPVSCGSCGSSPESPTAMPQKNHISGDHPQRGRLGVIVANILFIGTTSVGNWSGRWDSNPRPPEPHPSGRKPRLCCRFRICNQRTAEAIRVAQLRPTDRPPEIAQPLTAQVTVTRYSQRLSCGCYPTPCSRGALTLGARVAGSKPVCCSESNVGPGKSISWPTWAVVRPSSRQ